MFVIIIVIVIMIICSILSQYGNLYFVGIACAQNRIYLGMTTIKDLILKRPNLKTEFLDILLNFTSHEKAEVVLLPVFFTCAP